jgi:hypothetical protein
MAKEETVINTVTMTDGRIVEFAGKKRLIKTSGVDEKGLFVRLDFINGEHRTFYLPQDLITKFALHGAEQKLGDETAGVVDIEDMVMGVDDLIDRLYNLEWSAKREASALAGATVLAKALVEVTGKSLVEVRAFLATKTQAEKMALRGSPRIKPIIVRLEEAKAKNKRTPSIDTDALLGDLTGAADAAA